MASETASDYYKKTDLADIATSGSWNDLSDTPTTIAGYGITDAYTKSEIDGKLGSGMHYKGTVASVENLPTTGQQIGDLYNVTDTGANYAWSGTAWDKLSENIDLSIYDNHIADTNNPHEVTAAQVGLGNVDNTSDLDKPISTATQNALDLKANLSDFNTHANNHNNPHQVTKEQVGLGNVDNTSDLDKPISTATQAALDGLSGDINEVNNDLIDHMEDTSNPHEVTAAQVGLGNVDNTSDLDKPISTATQTALDEISGDISDVDTKVDTHIANTSNPHNVTKAQVGLGNVDNTADLDKPISTATQTALDEISDDLSNHITDTSNPHEVTAAQVGLGNVDNTSDLDKPISTATQTALDGKVDKTSGVSKVYGTDAQGNQTTYDYTALGKVDDVKVAGTSVVTNKIANLGSMASETAADYSTKAVADTLYADIAYENTIDTHIADTSNPHSVTKAQVGLGNVDNTADLDKPISTATQTALNGKVSDITVGGTSVVNNMVASLGTMASETASDYYKKNDLADVATSGSYNDLIDKPAWTYNAQTKNLTIG